MKPELLIRPSFNDHEAIENILVPGPRSVDQGPPPLDRLVLDAHAAMRRPQFADAAERSGIPVLIDPLTFLAQGELDEDDAWLRVPFAQTARELDDKRMDEFVDQVLSFELDQRATMIVPPYFYSSKPGDLASRRNSEVLESTKRWLKATSIELPVVPVLCGKLQGLATEDGWERTIDPFLESAIDLNVGFIALCVSPIGHGKEGVGKLMDVFNMSRRIGRSFDVVAWRQGVYGPALVAAGVMGYESGIATREQCNIRASIASRKKKPKGPDDKTSGGSGYGVLFEAWNRSLPSRVVEILMRDDSLRARLMCLDEMCCPAGHDSTLADRRGHALRTRARQLRTLSSQPRRWQLYHVERSAFDGITLAGEANKLLERTELKDRIKTVGLSSLADASRRLRERDASQDVA